MQPVLFNVNKLLLLLKARTDFLCHAETRFEIVFNVTSLVNQ